MEIDYSTSGFLKDASYSFYIYQIGKEFEEQFNGLDKLNINIKELLYHESALGINQKSIEFSADRKKCTLNLTQSKFYDIKGKVIGTPQPYDVFSHLRFMLMKAADEYKALNSLN